MSLAVTHALAEDLEPVRSVAWCLDGRFVAEVYRRDVDIGGLAQQSGIWGLAIGGRQLAERVRSAGRAGQVTADDVAWCYLCAHEHRMRRWGLVDLRHEWGPFEDARWPVHR